MSGSSKKRCCCELEPPNPCDIGGLYLVTISGVISAHPLDERCDLVAQAMNATHVVPFLGAAGLCTPQDNRFSHCTSFEIDDPIGLVTVMIRVGCLLTGRVINVIIVGAASKVVNFFFPPLGAPCGCPILHPQGAYVFFNSVGSFCVSDDQNWSMSLAHG